MKTGSTVRGVIGLTGMLAVAAGTLGLAGSAAMGQCSPGWVTGFSNFGIGNDSVRAAVALADGDVVVGGSFTLAGGVAVARTARYDFATQTWSPLGPVASSTSNVYALAVLPDGDVLAGGNFSSLGGGTTNRFARFDMDTQTWADQGYGTQGGQVNAIAVLPGGDIIVGGNMPRVSGFSTNHIARYRPSTGVWTTMGSNFVSSGDVVRGLAVAPDGTVIVGGTFTAGGKNHVGRYHPDTNTWSTLGTGVNGAVRAVAVLPDGDVIAAGDFSQAGGAPAALAARFDVQTQTWSPLAVTGLSGHFGYVTSLAVRPDGTVVLGGSFAVAGGVGAGRIAHYNPDTNTFLAMAGGTNQDVNCLAVLPGGDAVAGGFFSSPGARMGRYSFGGVAPVITDGPEAELACGGADVMFEVAATGAVSYQWRKDMAPIDTIANPSAATATLTLSGVRRPDIGSYDCVVSGSCGSATSGAATLSVCPADLNCDGGVDIDDLLVFLSSFEMGAPAADLNSDANNGLPDGGVDINDLLYFLARFEAGC